MCVVCFLAKGKEIEECVSLFLYIFYLSTEQAAAICQFKLATYKDAERSESSGQTGKWEGTQLSLSSQEFN